MTGTLFSLDSMTGNVTASTTNIPGINYNYSYNQYGQIASETNPYGLSTNYTYNTKGYLNKISNAYNTQNFTAYDTRGNLTDYNNSRGVTGKYTVNKYNEVTNEKITSAGSLSPLNFNATYNYLNNGNLNDKTTTSGITSNSYNYTYDNRDNLLSETETGMGTTSYSYDNNDNVKTITDKIGNTVNMNYNNRDLMSTLSVGTGPTASTYSFDYDGNGNVASSTNAEGNVTFYNYDGFDRVWSIVDPLSNKTVLKH